MGRPKGGQYEPAEVDKALLAYIRTRNYDKAQEITGIKGNTIAYWTKPGHRHYQRYIELQNQVGPELEAQAINDARGLINTYAEKEREAIQALDVSKLEPRDIPGAIRNLATSKALNADKILPLDGREHKAREQQSYDQLVQTLQKLAPQLFAQPVTSEAVEVKNDESPAVTGLPERSG